MENTKATWIPLTTFTKGKEKNDATFRSSDGVEEQIKKFVSGKKKRVLHVTGLSGCGKSFLVTNAVDALTKAPSCEGTTVRGATLCYAELQRLDNLYKAHDLLTREIDKENLASFSPFDYALDATFPASTKGCQYVVVLHRLDEFWRLTSIMVKHILEQRSDIHFIIISRKVGTICMPQAMQLKVPKLSKWEAQTLVAEYLGSVEIDNTVIAKLCKKLRNFPLAIKQACRVITKRKCTVLEYLWNLEQKIKQETEKGALLLDGVLTVTLVATSTLALDTLQLQPEIGQFSYQLFQILLSFGVEHISRQMLNRVALAVLGEPGNSLPFTKGLGTLQEYGLISHAEETIRLYDWIRHLSNIECPKMKNGLKPITCFDTLKFASEMLDEFVPYACGTVEHADPAISDNTKAEVLYTEVGVEDPVDELEDGTPSKDNWESLDGRQQSQVSPVRKSTRLRRTIKYFALWIACVTPPLLLLHTMGFKRIDYLPPITDVDITTVTEMSIFAREEFESRKDSWTAPYIISHGLGRLDFDILATVMWLEIQGPISVYNLDQCLKRCNASLEKLVLNVGAMTTMVDTTKGLANLSSYSFTRLSELLVEDSNEHGLLPWNISIRSEKLNRIILLRSRILGKSYEDLCLLLLAHSSTVTELVLKASDVDTTLAQFRTKVPLLRVRYLPASEADR